MLKKSVNFATNIDSVSYLDLIARVEKVVFKISKGHADEIIFKVTQTLKKVKLLISNINI